MARLLRFSGLIDAINRKVGIGIGWLILVMTIVSALNATSRKLFSVSSNAFLEIQWYLFAAVFLLAAGYTLLSNEHVRVDIVNTRMPTRLRLWVELICSALFLVPFTLLVIYYAWPYFMLSFSSGEWSPNAGGLVVWPVKLLIPVSFLLLFLQGVSQIIKLAAALSGRLDAGPLLDRHSVQEEEVEAVLSRQKNGGGGDR